MSFQFNNNISFTLLVFDDNDDGGDDDDGPKVLAFANTQLQWKTGMLTRHAVLVEYYTCFYFLPLSHFSQPSEDGVFM